MIAVLQEDALGERRYPIRNRKCRNAFLVREESSDSRGTDNTSSSESGHSSEENEEIQRFSESSVEQKRTPHRSSKRASKEKRNACTALTVSRLSSGSVRQRIDAGSRHSQSKLFEMIRDNRRVEWANLIESWSVNYTENPLPVCISLLNLILEAAGFPQSFVTTELAEGVHPEDVIAGAVTALETQGYTLRDKFPAYSGGNVESGSFSARYRSFWKLLGETFDSIILSRQFAEDIFSWILPLTSHSLRNIRQTGCVAGLCFLDGLLSRLETAQKEARKYELQYKSESLQRKRQTQTQRESSQSLVLRHLEKQITACDQCRKKLKTIVDTVFLAVPNVRWRDRCPFIRKETFIAIFGYMERASAIFLKDTQKNQLIGWALFDREDGIREVAAGFLRRIVTRHELWNTLTKNGEFLKMFLSRLVELPEDKHYPVCIAGLTLLTHLAEKDILTDHHVEKVIQALWTLPSLLTMERDQISITQRRTLLAVFESFADFINSTIFSVSVLQKPSRETEKNMDQDSSPDIAETKDTLALRCILEFLVEFVDDHAMHMDIFVTAFWLHAPCLRRIDLMVKLLTVRDTGSTTTSSSTSSLSDKYRAPLILLLQSVLHHLELAAVVASTPRRIVRKYDALFRTKDSVASDEPIEDIELSTASEIVFKELVPLLRVSKGNAAEFRIAVAVIHRIALHLQPLTFGLTFTSVVEYVADTFINCMDITSPLQLLAATFSMLERYSGENVTNQSELMMKRLASCFNEISARVKNHLTSEMEDQIRTDKINVMVQSDSCMQKLLMKLVAFSQSANINPYTNNWDVVDFLNTQLAHLPPEKTAQEDSYKISLANLMLSMQCLVLAYIHLWADLEKEVEQPGDPYCIDTSRDSQSLKSVDAPVSESTRRVMRKRDSRISGMTSRPLRKRNKMSERPHVPGSSLDAESTLFCLLEKMERLGSMIRKRCSVWFQVDSVAAPFLSYTASMALLDITRFREAKFFRDRNKPVSDCTVALEKYQSVLQNLELTPQEFRSVITHWTRQCMEAEKILEDERKKLLKLPLDLRNSSPLQCFLFNWTDVPPLTSHEESYIPILGGLLDGSFLKSGAALNPGLANSQYRDFVLCTVALFIRRLALSSLIVQVLESSLGPTILTLLWYRHQMLDAAITLLVQECLSIDTLSPSANPPERSLLIWTWLVRSIVLLYKDTQKRERLKVILCRVAKWIPPQLYLPQSNEFFNLVEQAYHECVLSSNQTTGKNASDDCPDTTYFTVCIKQLLPKFKNLDDQSSFVALFQRSFSLEHPLYRVLQPVIMKHYPRVNSVQGNSVVERFES